MQLFLDSSISIIIFKTNIWNVWTYIQNVHKTSSLVLTLLSKKIKWFLSLWMCMLPAANRTWTNEERPTKLMSSLPSRQQFSFSPLNVCLHTMLTLTFTLIIELDIRTILSSNSAWWWHSIFPSFYVNKLFRSFLFQDGINIRLDFQSDSTWYDKFCNLRS